MIARTIVAWTAWPGLLAACVATTALGFARGGPTLTFDLTLLLLERPMPRERKVFAPASPGARSAEQGETPALGRPAA